MKIYFAGSIRGGRDDAALYRQIIAMLMEYGEVLTEHGGDASLTRAGEDGPSDGAIYGRDMAWPTPWPPRSPSQPRRGIRGRLGRGAGQARGIGQRPVPATFQMVS